jgi:N-acyl homoserine lactone hydrolase
VEIGASAFVPGATADKKFAPVWSALLRTPEGNVLFDTGLHPVHVERPDATFGPGNALKVVMAKEDAVVARLASLGIRPDDVTIVVNSHLHFDHAGNNGAFPKATFLVQSEHLAFAKGKPNFPGVYWDIPELTYIPVAGRTRVARGVEVVPTPGHAPGHQSLVVDLAKTGRVVLCGDAAFTRENLQRGEIRAPDEAAAKESLALIRSLVNDDLDRVFTSHDAASWPGWRHAPETYR